MARRRRTASARLPLAGSRVRDVVGAYVGLTKPRIIELLLVTTVPAMFLAAGEVPRLSLVLATMVGGCLAAASANAFNCVLDRDIDERMRRTRRRWRSCVAESRIRPGRTQWQGSREREVRRRR